MGTSDEIPAEVWIQIFLRLPVVSILRCRCICKEWFSLITDKRFIFMYNEFASKNHRKNTILSWLYLGYSKKAALIPDRDIDDLSFPDDGDSLFYLMTEFPSRVNNIGSSNALLCLQYSSGNVLLYNPSLGRSIAVPQPSPKAMVETSYSFAFDHKNSDYKVLRIAHLFKNFFCVRVDFVEVFSLSVGSWRKVDIACSVPVFLSRLDLPAAFVNGAFHWISCDGDSNGLVLFDLGNEVFKRLKVPFNTAGKSIGVFGQCVSLFEYFNLNNSCFDNRCCIWVMKEYGVAESWTMQFKIDLGLGVDRVLRLRRNGEILLVTAYNREVASYDPVSRKVKGLGIYTNSGEIFVDTCVNSLDFLDGVGDFLGQPNAFSLSRRVQKLQGF